MTGDSPVDVAALETMCTSMRHRGPDGHATLARGSIGLAHTRLSLFDLSDAGAQPWHEGDHALVFNGEIYNHVEMRRELEASGQTFTSRCDTEVLFRSLVLNGVERTLDRLRGMFAFAFVDLATGSTHLCRDRMGIKPLLLMETPRGLAFASEAKALAAAGPLRPDPIQAMYSLTGLADQSPRRSIFAGVQQVQPGEVVEVSNGRIRRRWRYFVLGDLVSAHRYNEQRTLDAVQATRQFRELLEVSVIQMLQADARVGAFVSGGVDSSLIAALADRNASSRFGLFTAHVTGRHSEFDTAQSMARTLGRPLHSVKFAPEHLLRDWALATWHYETPLIKHANAAPFAQVARLANGYGTKAVLTGEGSDELFLGYPPLIFERYRRVIEAPLQGLDRAYSFSPELARAVLQPRSNPTLAFLKDAASAFETSTTRSEAESRYDFLPHTHRQLAAQSLWMLEEHLLSLLHRNDRMGMLASIESRFPYLDEAVVEFAVNLPIERKIERTWRPHSRKHPFLLDKGVVRRAAAEVLPGGFAWRQKQGFPMHGLRDVRFDTAALGGGYVADLLSLDRRSLEHLGRSDPYEAAKLLSVEVFGRLFSHSESIDSVSDWVTSTAAITVS